jgi:ubiquinone/menaquinone biosynthesis C-methylase UbiE
MNDEPHVVGKSMNAYSPKEYWTGVAEKFHSADASGFAPVLHPGAPVWFNRLIDDLQFQAIRRALAMAALPPHSRILDVGCGTGRWVRRYLALGHLPTGVDATPGMLRIARQQGTAPPLLAGEAFRLPFPDAAFDCVTDVTVVQHIPADLQPKALGEMVRVLKPGGRLILFELIRGKGAHIFPRAPQDWIHQVSQAGAKPIGWFGQEFLLFDRIVATAVHRAVGKKSANAGDAELISNAAPGKMSASRRAYWKLRRITAQVSAWTDPAAEKICPARLATHGVFIFQK